MDVLKKHVKSKTPGPLYIFHGAETYLREYYLKELKSMIVPEGTETFNVTYLDKSSFTPAAFTEALDAAPFMSERRLVVVRDADIFKGDNKEALEAVFKAKWEETTAVFVYTDFKADARTKLYKAIAAFAVIAEFKPQTEKDLIPWIKRRFAALGKQIDTPDAQHFIFLCGRDMTTLIGEIEKIAAYAHTEQVTQRHIDAVGTPTVEAVAFDLTDAIAAGEFGKALDLLHNLIDMREEPIMLMGAIGKQVRGLYLARLVLDSGQGRDVVMRGMGYYHTYPADKLLWSAKKLSLEWCRRAVLACARTDSSLKLGMDKPLTLERLIMEMA